MIGKAVFAASRAIGVAALLAAGILALPHQAAAQDARAFIDGLGKQAIQVMGPSVPPAERTARFRELFARDFDLHGAGRFVLGPYANAMNPEQQQEFIGLFREYLAQAYARRLGEYGGEPFQVTGSRPGGNETIVTSQVLRRGGQPIEIDWHVAELDGRPVITDVQVDGVSMKVTHRSEFASIIQRNGGRPEALLAAMRQQIGQSPATRTGSSSPPTHPQSMPAPAQPMPAPAR
jgi:phospholipid transport system substrate-binding protein